MQLNDFDNVRVEKEPWGILRFGMRSTPDKCAHYTLSYI